MLVGSLDTLPGFVPEEMWHVMVVGRRDLMSLIKPVGIRVTVAPVSISKFVITPFTFALINIPASGASLCTPTEPGVLSDDSIGQF
jgi:hypothetical protein